VAIVGEVPLAAEQRSDPLGRLVDIGVRGRGLEDRPREFELPDALGSDVHVGVELRRDPHLEGAVPRDDLRDVPRELVVGVQLVLHDAALREVQVDHPPHVLLLEQAGRRGVEILRLLPF